MKRICVFCGASTGTNPAYQDAAVDMGRTLAKNGIDLVYGGGNKGLMGMIADATIEMDKEHNPTLSLVYLPHLD